LNQLEEAATQVQRGDMAAFQRIVHETSDRLVRLCARILGNLQDAEDATQETYLKAYRALVQGQFDRRSSLRTWLYRIATNTALDLRRMRRALPSDQLSLAPAPGEQPELRLALHELSTWLDALPDEQRIALLLSAIEGLPSAEIGEILGCSEGAVEQRLVRARAHLRRRRGDGHEP
jgi:RNA polymerase sigma-70 factor (ECF subfamily)